MKVSVTSQVSAYGALIGVTVLAGVAADLLSPLLASVFLTIGAVLGVLAGSRFGALSFVGVGVVVALVTLVMPVVLAATAGLHIAGPALAAGATSNSVPANVSWYAVAPTVAALMTLWFKRQPGSRAS